MLLFAAGFLVETVVKGIDIPWSLNPTPDGKVLFTSRDEAVIKELDLKKKSVRIVGKPSHEVRVEGEAGMLGMALDPDYIKNRTVYICYSYFGKSKARLNRLSRFEIRSTGLDNEKILVDEIFGGVYHNGCRVVAGPDRSLYLTTGEGYEEQLAQQKDSLGGKILRVNRDGTIPKDNPFPGNLVWTLGHRNSQGLAFQPGSGVLWATEHGPDVKDEINIIKKGRNYGWPKCRGKESCPGIENYEPAIREYNADSTIAISDLTFYSGKMFPEWKGDIIFTSLKAKRLYHAKVRGQSIVSDEVLIDRKFGRLRDVVELADGSLLISTSDGKDSKILRLYR